MLRRAGALTAVVLAGGLLAAGPASGAATISRSDASTLFYDADATETPRDGISLEIVGASVEFDILTARETITPVAPCAFVNGTSADVICPRAGIARIVFDLDAGNDLVDADPFGSVFDIPVIVDAGPGDDFFTGSAAADVVRGGPGGDSMNGRAGADDFSGGDGFDRASYGGATPVNVSIDDVADDGTGDGAEGDNVHTDVEDVFASTGNDRLTGSAAGNVLEGRAGNDVIEGGGGIDVLLGEEGDDVLLARDGEAERAACGPGTDSAITDDVDDPAGCEAVDASGELVRDLDKDGIAKPEDCKDDDPAVRPGVADPPGDGFDQNCDGVDATVRDADADGVQIPFDCNDADGAIRPGATEVYGNAVDEDCSGRADPLLTILSPVLSSFLAGNRATPVRRLEVTALEPGMRIEVRCSGRGCPFARRNVAVPAGATRVDLRRRLRLRRIRRSPTLEVRVLREDSVGRVARFRFRRRKVPRISVLCMSPADTSPRRCAS